MKHAALLLLMAVVTSCHGTALPVITCTATPQQSPLPKGAYAGQQWCDAAAKLTKAERSELADMTPQPNLLNGNTTWNAKRLRWEQDFQWDPNRKGKTGPVAILPMSVARAEDKRRQEDARWCDPSTMLGLGDGYHQYYCKPDPNGPPGRKGRIAENVEAEKALVEAQARIDALAAALTTRVLSPAEMKQVLHWGPQIFVHPMEPYSQEDIDERYVTALKIQNELRLQKGCGDGSH